MGVLDDSFWKAEWIGAPWQGEKPYKKVEPEKPLPIPPGMPKEMFYKIVQQYMDNPQSGILGISEVSSR